ncbi:MAG: ABC transporter ATP-binding protein [Anaerolineaceae bacterium]|nr:ABC transporter ATP-binding protein [Anaerolineaceae bacterium]
MKHLLKLFRFLKPYWLWAILAPLAMVLEVVMDLQQPRLTADLIDIGVANLDLNFIYRTGGTMVLFALIGAVGGVGSTIYAMKASMAFSADLRSELFKTTQKFSFANLDRFETGQLITRLSNDVTQIQDVVGMVLRIMVRIPMLLVGSVVMAIVTTPQLAYLLAIFFPLVLILVALLISKAFPLFRLVQKKLDRMNVVMQENLSGIRVVKAFLREDYESRRFFDANNEMMNTILKAIYITTFGMPFMMLFVNFGIASALWVGGKNVLAGTLQVGQIIAFINYLTHATFSLFMLAMLIMRISRSVASAERLDEILTTEPQIQNQNLPKPAVNLHGLVEFKQASFKYGDESDPVLKEISFSAKPGETVAILGSTGSGKSSLVNLIPRFYDVSQGSVCVDGIDVREYDKHELRKKIGIALQEAILFSGTIRDNIRYGRPSASDEEVIAAAKAAQAHDFIMSFNDQYDTEIGQRGVNLSGGQKQRIAIARALLVQPTILILDDSTSAVDVETEIKIQEALTDIMKNRTSFIIAQRISTVLNADKILVLNDGRMVAEGTHEELMASSPIYQDIFESQLGKGVNLNAG